MFVQLDGGLSGSIIYGESFCLLAFSCLRRSIIFSALLRMAANPEANGKKKSFIVWGFLKLIIVMIVIYSLPVWNRASYWHEKHHRTFLVVGVERKAMRRVVGRWEELLQKFLIRFGFTETNSDLWHVILITSLSLFEQRRCQGRGGSFQASKLFSFLVRSTGKFFLSLNVGSGGGRIYCTAF